MARDFWQKTFTYRDAADNNAIKAAAGIEVRVYAPGTTNPLTVYGSRVGTDVTPLTQPITSGASGTVQFYADVEDYDVAIHDTVAPARIGDATIYWNATSGDDRGTPSSKIAADGSLPWNALDAMSKRQIDPLGTVIEWWRPNSTYDAGAGAGNPPPGWEPCDGRVIVQANHDFGAIGSITLPDMRNRFVLGADITKSDGTAATPSTDGAAAAPGVRAAGGTNIHSHSIPAHYHNSRAAGATISASGGSHTHTTSGTATAPITGAASGLGDSGRYAMSNAIGTNYTNGIPVAGTAAAATHTHPNSEFSGLVGLVTGGVSGDAVMTSGTTDSRPTYIGLIHLMKVRRS